MNIKHAFKMDDHYARIINLPKTLKTILSVLVSSGILATIVLALVNGNLNAIIALSTLTILSIFLYTLNERGYHRIVSFGAFILSSSVLAYIQFTNNGLYDVSLLAYPALIVFSSLLLGKQFVAPVTLIMVTILTILQKLTFGGIVTPYDGLLITTNQDYWSIITAMLVTGVLVYIIISLIEGNVTKTLDSEERVKLVYESTLKGWARALELRDHEMEGHGQRVTQLTIDLAKKIGIAGNALTAVRWGALLHDIGKMSVPDDILLKPGRLTNEEFEAIKEHPVTAKILLENIPYLQSAMDIPYAHHERWDGSGYPRGLKGENIPLPARVFAVIDVWDALRSERPYKRAWSDKEAMDYLQEHAGILFDPSVVYAFEELLADRRSADNIGSV